MIESPQNLKDQLLNLTETIATEMKTLKNNKLDKTGKAKSAESADKAISDSAGNNIPSTYATKDEVKLKASKDSPIFTGTVTASTFSGNLYGNATSATMATQDSQGNIIHSFYATKSDLNTKLDKTETAASASKATTDSSGNKFEDHYANKTELVSKINRTGNRGQLSGNEIVSIFPDMTNITITKDSDDTIFSSVRGTCSLTFTPAPESYHAIKVIALKAKDTVLALNINGAVWANKGTAPTWGTAGKNLVLVANFIGSRVILSVADNDE